jgi:hypothetical protein
MIPFDPDKFIESLFGSATVSVQDLMSQPLPVLTPEPPKPQAEEPKLEIQKEKPVSAVSASPIGSPLFAQRDTEKPLSETPDESNYSPPPKPVVQPPPPPPTPEPSTREEPKEEKKSRFGGLFGRKKDDKKEEEERKAREKKEKEDKKKRKDDKEKKDDVVYLTDEDIEDMLK